jgi:hypothetical protein
LGVGVGVGVGVEVWVGVKDWVIVRDRMLLLMRFMILLGIFVYALQQHASRASALLRFDKHTYGNRAGVCSGTV